MTLKWVGSLSIPYEKGANSLFYFNLIPIFSLNNYCLYSLSLFQIFSLDTYIICRTYHPVQSEYFFGSFKSKGLLFGFELHLIGCFC